MEGYSRLFPLHTTRFLLVLFLTFFFFGQRPSPFVLLNIPALYQDWYGEHNLNKLEIRLPACFR